MVSAIRFGPVDAAANDATGCRTRGERSRGDYPAPVKQDRCVKETSARDAVELELRRNTQLRISESGNDKRVPENNLTPFTS